MRRILRLASTAVLAGLLMLPSLRAAHAVQGWFTAEVSAAGIVTNGTLFIRLTDVGTASVFTDRFFIGDPAVAKSQLAIALTAMTNDMRVLISTDPDFPGNPVIFVIFLTGRACEPVSTSPCP